MCLDYALRYRESQPCSLPNRLGCEKRVKNRPNRLRSNATTRIRNCHPDKLTFAVDGRFFVKWLCLVISVSSFNETGQYVLFIPLLETNCRLTMSSFMSTQLICCQSWFCSVRLNFAYDIFRSKAAGIVTGPP